MMIPTCTRIDWQRVSDELAFRLSTARRARRVSQVDLAEAAGITRSQVQVLEYGRAADQRTPTNPTLRTVYELSRALGIMPGSLLPTVDVALGWAPLPRMCDIEGLIVEEVLADVAFAVLPVTTRVSWRMPDLLGGGGESSGASDDNFEQPRLY